MEKAEQHIQSEYIRIAPILLNWNDICNADMKELYAIGFGTLGTKDLKENNIIYERR